MESIPALTGEVKLDDVKAPFQPQPLGDAMNCGTIGKLFSLGCWGGHIPQSLGHGPQDACGCFVHAVRYSLLLLFFPSLVLKG